LFHRWRISSQANSHHHGHHFEVDHPICFATWFGLVATVGLFAISATFIVCILHFDPEEFDDDDEEFGGLQVQKRARG
jgi:hypothetical protein